MPSIPTFPHVNVHGSAEERGRQYGEHARDQIIKSIAAYGAVFERLAGMDWATVRAQAQRFAQPIQEFDPKYMREIEGIAYGAGVDTVDVLALNIRTEVMSAAKARQARGAAEATHECSSFALLPQGTSTGHTLIGQNWDWLMHASDTVVVLEAQQNDGPDFVTIVEAGLLAKIGFNSAGIGLATNALTTEDDVGAAGVPYHIILRAILDCGSVPDALAVIQRRIRSSSANYTIAHEDGVAVAVETTPGDFSRIQLLFPDQGMLFHTNHYCGNRLDSKSVSLWLSPDSPFRLERLEALIRLGYPHITVDLVQAALADHVNYPQSVCYHPDERLPTWERGASVASLIMDLNARRMWLTDGNPCSSSYRDLDYASFLDKA